MPNFKITAILAVAGLALSTGAFAQDAETDAATQAEAVKIETPSSEGVVTDAATCEYEGGSVMDLTDGTICFIPIRGVAANTQVYDGMKLGVIRCEGNGAFSNEIATPNDSYCRVYLTEKVEQKTREELEAELAAMTAEELEANN